MMRSSFKVAWVLLLGLLFAAPVWGGRAYIWRDQDGKLHFSDQAPTTESIQGEVEKRTFKTQGLEDGSGDASPPTARSPIEHAVHSTFRLANRTGGGSGFFISPGGLAITAKHVVTGVTYSMDAELPGDSRKYTVRILKRDPDHDLALLQVNVGRPVPYLQLRDPLELARGEEVYAIGNPLLAFRDTVTKGIFSRIFPEEDIRKELKVKLPYKGDWVQFSAQVTGGNSGGPVVDSEGRVVGVVSLGFQAYGAINLAVPSSYILKDFPSFLK